MKWKHDYQTKMQCFLILLVIIPFEEVLGKLGPTVWGPICLEPLRTASDLLRTAWMTSWSSPPFGKLGTTCTCRVWPASVLNPILHFSEAQQLFLFLWGRTRQGWIGSENDRFIGRWHQVITSWHSTEPQYMMANMLNYTIPINQMLNRYIPAHE